MGGDLPALSCYSSGKMEVFDRMIAIRAVPEVAGFDGGRVRVFFQADLFLPKEFCTLFSFTTSSALRLLRVLTPFTFFIFGLDNKWRLRVPVARIGKVPDHVQDKFCI